MIYLCLSVFICGRKSYPKEGTGLGLPISRQIVVEKHGGSLSCNSVLGKGTEFAIAISLHL